MAFVFLHDSVLFKDEDGKFNEEGAMDDLIETYGVEKVTVKAVKAENKETAVEAEKAEKGVKVKAQKGVKAEKGAVKAEGEDVKKRSKKDIDLTEESTDSPSKAKKPKLSETVAVRLH